MTALNATYLKSCLKRSRAHLLCMRPSSWYYNKRKPRPPQRFEKGDVLYDLPNGCLLRKVTVQFYCFPLKSVGPKANVLVINNCFREQMIRAIRLEDSYFPAKWVCPWLPLDNDLLTFSQLFAETENISLIIDVGTNQACMTCGFWTC